MRQIVMRVFQAMVGAAAAATALLLASLAADARPPGRKPDASFQAGELPEFSTEWMLMIARQIPSLIWTTDTALNIRYIVGADARWLADNPAELVGKPLSEIVETDDPDAPPVRAHLQALRGRSTIYTITQAKRDFDVRVEPMRLPHGEIIGCISLAVDVTGQRQVEKALQHVRARLETMAQERAAALSRSNELLVAEIKERERTEQELRRSEERYRGIIESQRDLVVRTDIENRFTFVNDAYCRKFGRQREELVGSSYWHLVHPDDLAATREVLERIKQPPYRMTLEQRALTVDGWRWIAWEDYAIRDDEGNIVEIQAVGRDITRRVEAARAEHEQRVLAEALRDTASALNSTLKLDEVLERILANVGRVVPHDAANVMLLDESGHVKVERAEGYRRHGLHEIVMGANFHVDSVASFSKMFHTCEPLLILDTYQNPQWVDLHGVGWVRSYIGTPIAIGDEILGFINLDCGRPDAFRAEDVERLKAFTDQAAIAIRNARLYEQAQELAAVEAAMEERQRIARELHDAVSQSLFSASIIAQSLPRLWELSHDEVQSALEELNRLTRGALAEMRTLLLEMRPDDLADVTLDDLLRQLVEAFRSRSSAEITLAIEGRHRLTPEVRVALYRITQEALNNVIKHARAEHAAVYLHSTDEGTELRIVDDGRGFDRSAVLPDRIGLNIMQERARLIGATLEISSQKEQGTEVRVKWLDPRPEEQW